MKPGHGHRLQSAPHLRASRLDSHSHDDGVQAGERQRRRDRRYKRQGVIMADRTCADCRAILSRYNPGDRCGPCTYKDRR